MIPLFIWSRSVRESSYAVECQFLWCVRSAGEAYSYYDTIALAPYGVADCGYPFWSRSASIRDTFFLWITLLVGGPYNDYVVNSSFGVAFIVFNLGRGVLLLIIHGEISKSCSMVILSG